jgi:hypothetical protein
MDSAHAAPGTMYAPDGPSEVRPDLPPWLRGDLADPEALNITVLPDGGVAIHGGDAEEEDEGPKPAFLRHEFDANLAEHLTDFELGTLAMDLQQGIDADKNDRHDWEEINARAVEYLGLKVMREPTGDNTDGGVLASVTDPLTMDASTRFWANAVAEFLPANGPCKVRDDAPPPVQMGQGQPGIGHNGGPPIEEATAPGGSAVNRSELAQAFEDDMNHYLTKVEKGYYRDFSRMLFALGPTGTQFRKVYWNPLRGRPVSEWVKAADLIVSSDATCLETAARVTQLIRMSQADARRLQLSGWWRDVPLVTPTEEQTPEQKEIAEAEGVRRSNQIDKDRLHTIEECYTEIDLPGFEHADEDGVPDGMPLPYRVTIDKDSRQVLEVRRNWREDDALFVARQRFIMFGMIPGLGFYYLGFLHVLGNGQRTLTAILRQLLDAGQFANFPAWLIAKGLSRQVSTDLRAEPGQGVEIDLAGKAKLADVVMEMPYKGPSQVLAELADAFRERLEKLASTASIPVGEGTADVPVGTVIATVEQGTKIMAAVHKGLHASRADELEALRELIAEDPSVLSKWNKNPARRWEQAEEFEDLDLVPSSDPNVPSQLHRIILAWAKVQLATSFPGLFNPRAIATSALRTIGEEVTDDLFAPPQSQPAPPPDLKGQAALMNAQTNQAKAAGDVQAQTQETQRKAAETVAEQEGRQQEQQMQAQTDAATSGAKVQIAQMQEDTQRLKLGAEIEKQHRDEATQAAGGIMGAPPQGNPSPGGQGP